MAAPWRTAWITGASTGIGRALAVALAERGVKVAASARSADKLAELARAHPGIAPLPRLGELLMQQGFLHPGQEELATTRRMPADAAPTERIGTHSLRDPAWVLPQWLRHATRHGATLPAGTVVTTGTWAGVVPLALVAGGSVVGCRAPRT